MGLNVRLYNINSNDYTISYSNDNVTYTLYGTFSGSSTTIDDLNFDTIYYIKIKNNLTNSETIKVIKTNDSKTYNCYDSISFYIDINCNNSTAKIYDLIEPHGNASSKINNIPCSYYIHTGETRNIEDSVFVTTGTTNQTTNEIYTFHNIPENKLVYVFLIHGDNYVLPSIDNICDCETFPKKQGGFNVNTIYCENVVIVNSNLFCYGINPYDACNCENDITLYYTDSLMVGTNLFYDNELTLPYTGISYLMWDGQIYEVSDNEVITINPCPEPPNSNLFCGGVTDYDACNCNEENNIILYYSGTLTTGTTLYVNNILTIPLLDYRLSLDGNVYYSATDFDGVITDIRPCPEPPNSLSVCTGNTCEDACYVCETPVTIYFDGLLTTGTTIYRDNILLNVYNDVDYISYSGLCYSVNNSGIITEIVECTCICNPISGVSIEYNSGVLYFSYDPVSGATSYTFNILDSFNNIVVTGTSASLPSVNEVNGLTDNTTYTIKIITNCENCESTSFDYNFITGTVGYITIVNNGFFNETIVSIEPSEPTFVPVIFDFPINIGQSISFTTLGYEGVISLTVVNTSGNNNNMTLYKGVYSECLNVNSDGTHSFSSIVVTPSDNIEIILSPGSCSPIV